VEFSIRAAAPEKAKTVVEKAEKTEKKDN